MDVAHLVLGLAALPPKWWVLIGPESLNVDQPREETSNTADAQGWLSLLFGASVRTLIHGDAGFLTTES